MDLMRYKTWCTLPKSGPLPQSQVVEPAKELYNDSNLNIKEGISCIRSL